MSTTVAQTTGDSQSATDGSLSPSEIIAEAEAHWDVSGSSILIAWALTAVSSALILLLFSWRRTKDPLIYTPRVNACAEYKKRHPDAESEGVFIPPVPIIDRAFLGWLEPIWMDFLIEVNPMNSKRVKERDKELLQLLGLDALTYLQFLRLLRWLFFAICVFVALPLTGVNYYINTQTAYGSVSSSPTSSATQAGSSNSTTGLLENLTVANISGNVLYIHVVFVYIATVLVFFFVSSHSYQHESLVKSWINLNRNEVAFRTIMVTDLEIDPCHSRQTSNGRKFKEAKMIDEVKKEVCKVIGAPPPGAKTTKVTLTHKNMGKLSKMVEEYVKKHFPRLDRRLTALLRRRKQGIYQVEYDNCWHRLGCGHSKTIESLIGDTNMKKLAIENEMALSRTHKDMEDSLPIPGTVTSAFVTFLTAKAAHEGLKICEEKIKRERKTLQILQRKPISVQLAPRSQRIEWRNLERDIKSRRNHAIMGEIALVLICFLNTIPLMAITILANLETAIQQIPDLRNLQNSSKLWKAFFTSIAGILPASIGAIFSYVLPYVMRYLSKWSGALTRGKLDEDVIRELFVFLLVSNVVIFSLLGIFYESYLTLADEFGREGKLAMWQSLGDEPAKITKAYISESSYWLSWYPVRAAVVCLELLQVPRIALKLFQIYILARTANDVKTLSEPRTFEYAIEYSHILFAMVVAFMYVPLAPLVVFCGTIYLWAASIVYSHQLKFVEDTKETDGKVWRVVLNRLLIGTTLMQLLLALTIGLKTQSFPMIMAACGPLIITAILWRHVGNRKTTGQIIGEMEDWRKEKKIVSVFEHDLLKLDWAPELHILPEDEKEFEKALDHPKYGDSLRSLLGMEIKKRRKKETKRG
ncbi:MAG: hypothetical protein TREMPRED_005048 [Tremellales sp. Tagirdzhanova-0007]|nr:MAG: hypothetical protein TREMPRED_005048 [Tremellales sp. Tagirdzhanova-0007]